MAKRSGPAGRVREQQAADAVGSERLAPARARGAAPHAADTQRALQLFVVLSRAAAAVGAHSNADIARHGLTASEFAVLEVLHHKGPLLLKDVQRKVLVSSGGMTYLVDRLADRGLVERRACATDRRAIYAALTPAGTDLISGIFPAHAVCIARAVEGLDAAEQEEAIELLRRLGRHAEARRPCMEAA